jgi:formylglycine-generating enzyme required for sulfatase activity
MCSRTSPYGTFDQGGNVYEWNETPFGSLWRGLRGGSWDFFVDNLAAYFPDFHVPTFEDDSLGFRVANIPEPTTIVGAALSLMGLLWRRHHG